MNSTDIINEFRKAGNEIIAVSKTDAAKAASALDLFLQEIAPDVETLTVRLASGDQQAMGALNLNAEGMGFLLATIGEGALADLKIELASLFNLAFKMLVIAAT